MLLARELTEQVIEGFRADILVDRQVVVEIKAVANLMPAHDAQVLTYLRRTYASTGFSISMPGC